MPSDYKAIRRVNRVEYGKAIDRIGRELLSNLYGDRTHFIFEILQNTEDALRKRGEWNGSRAVQFSLSGNALTIRHFGKPFDNNDVRGVCGIGESTKGLTDIGRFGIGFKSVYSFTDRPEIHSGQEHFTIDSYVMPKVARAVKLEPEETRIRIPLSSNKVSGRDDIIDGLQQLNRRTLLFLLEVDEISWSVKGGSSGQFQRTTSTVNDLPARRVLLTGGDHDSTNIEEEWLVFSREVFSEDISVGHIEIAFALNPKGNNQIPSMRRVSDSHLVVFFPTVLSTHLGFLIQGPYRTTPSRENIPANDDWNRQLVRETATFLVEALEGLRELGLLNVEAIECFPMDLSLFPEKGQFRPIFAAVREALLTKPLLPAYGGGHIAAQKAKMADSQGLRSLLGPQQLASLFPADGDFNWLSDEITTARTPSLRRYLIDELDVDEIDPEWLVPRLTAEFLEAQPDDWMEKLYAFLGGQRALLPRLGRMPLVRLSDDSHTVAFDDGQPQAYLPGDRPTGFPTVKQQVCQSDEARAFLSSLRLRVPDPVDDVITNILPKYDAEEIDISDDRYETDIEQILAAYATDSNEQRRRLVDALNDVKFVGAVDAGAGEIQFAQPEDVYMSTLRLKALFSGVPGVLLVNDSKTCLTGRGIYDLLRATKAQEYLAPISVSNKPTVTEMRELERKHGYWSPRSVEKQDYRIRGLDSLLTVLTSLRDDQAVSRSGLLWQALSDFQGSQSSGAFNGDYRWFYYTDRQVSFDAGFVTTLNETAWVPDKNGALQNPGAVTFKDTGWEENPILASKINFMPDTVEVLADELGLELGALTFMREHGISEAQLRERFSELFSIAEHASSPGGWTMVGDQQPSGASSNTSEGTGGPASKGSVSSENGQSGGSRSTNNAGATSGHAAGAQNGASRVTTGRQGGTSSGGREFVSYVKVIHDDSPEDPEGLSYEERMSIEEQAIALILAKEPLLHRTPPGNPGFDLKELNPEGEIVRWIEVKGMSKTLRYHPVRMTRTEFDCAREKQDAYWLYVVENVGHPSQSHIIRINNPAGKAENFTFDHGWVAMDENPAEQLQV